MTKVKTLQHEIHNIANMVLYTPLEHSPVDISPQKTSLQDITPKNISPQR